VLEVLGRVWFANGRYASIYHLTTPPSRQPPLMHQIFSSKNLKKKTGDPERGYYQYLKFSIAQKKWLSFGCG
jgi:hypothetical protein